MVISLETPITSPVLIGRAAQLGLLHRALDHTAAGSPGQVLLLSGEPGIGKSRLVAEARMAATARGMAILEGACLESEGATPYGPLLDLVRNYLAASSGAAMADAR